MYVINPQGKKPIFQINQHIGNDKGIFGEDGIMIQEGEGQGIDGNIFSTEVLSFNENDFVDELIFYINSQGGDVQQSLDIVNAISMSKKKTHAIITGFAYSCAGWIPMAADKVDMVRETGSWMCHMPYNPENIDQKSQFMDTVIDIISKIISSKSGRNGNSKKTQEDIKKLMFEKVYWDAERMHDEGLIDNIVEMSGKVVRLEKTKIEEIALNKSVNKAFYIELQQAQNNFILEQKEKKQYMQYQRLVNRLNKLDAKATGFSINLSDDAPEDAILETIVRLDNRIRVLNDDMMDKEKIVLDMKNEGEDIKNKLSEKEKEVKEAKKKAEDAETEFNKMKESYDKACMENKEMKEKEEAKNKEIEEAEMKFKSERAKNYIKELVDAKRIVASSKMTLEKAIAFWENEAVTNFESVEAKFETEPIKVSGPKPKFESNTLSSGKVLTQKDIENLRVKNMESVASMRVYTFPENGTKIRLQDGKVVN